MPIRSGIGIGEAQVFDTDGIIGSYGKILANQQKSDEKYAAELADLISKVDTKGVREADIPEITKYYNSIKDAYRKGVSTRNAQDRALYRAEVLNGIENLNKFANKSLEYKKEYTSLTDNFLKNPWMMDDEKKSRLQKMASLPLTQLGNDAVIDRLQWIPKPDNSLLNTLFKDVEGELKKKAFERTPISSIAKDGVKYEKFGVKPEEANELIASRLKLSPKAEYSIRSLYSEANPTLTNPTDQDLIKFARTVYESQYGGKDAYTFGDRRAISQSGSGRESSSEDVFAKYIIGAFGKERNSYSEKLRDIIGKSGNKATLTSLPDGSYKVTYKPVVDAISGPFTMQMENIAPITKIAKTPTELLGYLKDAGISTSWAKLYEKVSQGSKKQKAAGELD